MDEVTAGRLLFLIQASADNFKKGIKETQAQFTKLEKAVEQNKKAFSDVSKAAKQMTLVFAALGAAFAGLSKVAIDFNKTLANIQTLMPKNVKRVEEFRKAIQNMSIAVGKSTADLSEGMYQVISAFGDANDSVQKLEINAKAAVAGISSTLDAINLSSAVTKGYGDTTAAAVEKVMDLAFQTVKLGQTTFPELAGSLGRVIPIGAELKVELEDLFTVLATGTGVTGGAAEVTTQLRGILASMMNPTEDMINLFKKYGDGTAQSMIKTYGFLDTLKLMRKEQETSGKQLRDYIGRVEGQTLALALTGSQADTYVEKLKQMRSAQGAMQEAFEAQAEGVNSAGFAWQQAKSAAVVLAQTVGQELLVAVEDLSKAFVKFVTEQQELIRTKTHEYFEKVYSAIKKLVDFLKESKELIKVVLETIAGIYVAAKLAQFIILIKNLAIALKALAAVTVLSGSGLAIIASLAAGGAVVAGIKKIRDHLDHINSLKFEGVKVVTQAGEGQSLQKKNRQEFENSIVEAYKQGKTMIDMIKDLQSFTDTQIMSIYGTTKDVMMTLLHQTYQRQKTASTNKTATAKGKSYTGGLSSSGYGEKSRLKTQAPFDPYASAVTTYAEALERLHVNFESGPGKDSLNKMKQVFTETFKEIGYEIEWQLERVSYWFYKDILQGNWRDAFQNLRNLAADAAADVGAQFLSMLTVQGIESLADMLYKSVKEGLIGSATKLVLEKFWGWLKSSLTYLYQGITGVFKGMNLTVIKAMMESALSHLYTAGTWLYDGIKSALSNETLKSMVTGFTSLFRNVLTYLYQGITKVFSGSNWTVLSSMVNKFVSLFGNIYDTVETAVVSAIDNMEVAKSVEMFRKMFDKVKDRTESAVKSALEKGKDAWNAAKTFVDKFDDIYDIVSDAIKLALKIGNVKWAEAWNTFKGLFSGLEGTVSSALESALMAAAGSYAATNWIKLFTDPENYAKKHEDVPDNYDPNAADSIWYTGAKTAATSVFEKLGLSLSGITDDLITMVHQYWQLMGDANMYEATLQMLKNTGVITSALFDKWIDWAGTQTESFATGGIVSGILGQKKLITAHSGEEVLTTNDPRHSWNNGGSVVVNVTGNTLLNDNDADRLAEVITSAITKKMRSHQRYSIG